ncbi:MAG: hypothetical protein C4516_04805 [Oxalobacter sp.]|jgi:hypothetical protein|nr:MAG: hypothetical protein C4516_04805 [Oxalobacter sp.]
MSYNTTGKNARPIALAFVIGTATLFVGVHFGLSSDNVTLGTTAKHAALTVSAKHGDSSANHRYILREEDWKRIAKD